MAIKKTGTTPYPPRTTSPADDGGPSTGPVDVALTPSAEALPADAFASKATQDAFAQSAVMDAHPAFESARPSSVRRMSGVLERSLEQVTQDFAGVYADVERLRDDLMGAGFDAATVKNVGGDLSRLRRKARGLRLRKRQLQRRMKFLAADVPRTQVDSSVPASATPLARALTLAEPYGEAVATRFPVESSLNSAHLGTHLAHHSPTTVVASEALAALGVATARGPISVDVDAAPASGPLGELLRLSVS